MNPLRVYIAASADRSYARRVARAGEMLRERGIVVTSTWPETVARVGASNPRDASAAQRAEWAGQCLREIDDAHAVLFLVPGTDVPTRGAWLEVGYAHATGKIVVCSGDVLQSVFCALAVEYETDHAAIEHLGELELLEATEPRPRTSVADFDTTDTDEGGR